jgi:acyl-coenzyme A synthetase/AMP-(fatty) acid ligase
LIWINSLAFRGADYASDASCEASVNRRCRVVQPGKRTIAAPDVTQFAPRLPKTRFGKIMRRILRKIPAVVEDLIKNR